MKKSDYWVIEATVGMRFNVVFNESVDEKQAAEKLISGDYYDITDDEQLEILEAVHLEPQAMDED